MVKVVIIKVQDKYLETSLLKDQVAYGKVGRRMLDMNEPTKQEEDETGL